MELFMEPIFEYLLQIIPLSSNSKPEVDFFAELDDSTIELLLEQAITKRKELGAEYVGTTPTL